MSATAAMKVTMHLVNKDGVGDAIGTVTISKNGYGTLFTPDLKNLTPGLHGFHIHQNASCEPMKKNGDVVPGGAAGGHYDPKNKNQHGYPWGDGHLGDLPALFVDPDGNAAYPVLAPRVKLKHLKGRALMIHAGGDNYSDSPKPLGGGGSRVACGVIE